MAMKGALLLAVLGACSWMFAQEAGRARGLLERNYREGEMLVFRMTGSNDGRRYEARATGVVKRDPTGAFIEEYAWSHVTSNGIPLGLPPTSSTFRQVLSLDPAKPPVMPNLAGLHPILIGPVTDLLTFYVDLWLAKRLDKLARPGDHVYHQQGTPASWADGRYTVIGESSIDFDITLTQVDDGKKVATLLIRHVPPKKPQVRLPVAWMREPVADTPNNWINVTRSGRKYVAAVGKEIFDVELAVSLIDGKILSGRMENPVTAKERDCQDAALTDCGDSRPRQIMRRIEISLAY
jgi:hypothetical protein